jgi:hypothetical protein
MIMKKVLQLMAAIAACVPLLLMAQKSNVLLPQDKGPEKIDVSSYPAPIQSAYKLFSTKCSKCHTIARPINTLMKRDEWERYVKRMMHKPNSGINDSQGKKIFDFLIFDETSRKDKDPKSFFPALSDEEIKKLKAAQGQ